MSFPLARRLLVPSLIVLVSACAGSVSPEEPDSRDRALRGLTGVVVRIDGIEPDYRRLGVEEPKIRQEIERRLVAGGLPVVQPGEAGPSQAELVISLRAVLTSYRNYYSYSARLLVRQSVSLPQGHGAVAPLATWSNGTYGIVSVARFQRLNAELLALVDDFLIRFRQQNRFRQETNGPARAADP